MARTEVRSEMTGTVKEVLVTAGDVVAVGQEMLIIESMKMEVPIESPEEATVGEVMVEEGTIVEEGHLLLALEALV
jgi:acetyl-CoA carboxylase biotin carboxyl carrier protein